MGRTIAVLSNLVQLKEKAGTFSTTVASMRAASVTVKPAERVLTLIPFKATNLLAAGKTMFPMGGESKNLATALTMKVSSEKAPKMGRDTMCAIQEYTKDALRRGLSVGREVSPTPMAVFTEDSGLTGSCMGSVSSAGPMEIDMRVSITEESSTVEALFSLRLAKYSEGPGGTG